MSCLVFNFFFSKDTTPLCSVAELYTIVRAEMYLMLVSSK